MRAVVASAHFFSRRFEDACLWAEKAIQDRPSYPFANIIYPAARALMGDLEEARNGVARLRALDPALRVSSLREFYPLRVADDLALWSDGLRKAGLPE
jgi:hypothetical protein